MADVLDVTIVNGVPTAGSGTVATINKLMALVGEVVANPTDNTLLDRLKDINTTLTAGTVTVLGQAPMTASLPVAIASDQTSFPVNPGGGGTVSVDITRPADVVPYSINDALSDSTTAPTTGGFTAAGLGRVTGGSGVITEAVITTSGDPGTVLQGEIWLFDTAVTNVNDNAAFAVSDAEIKTYVGKIPFIMEDSGNNGSNHVVGVNLAYTCVGSTSLRFLVRVKNAYTPVSGEVLTVRLKYIYTS